MKSLYQILSKLYFACDIAWIAGLMFPIHQYTENKCRVQLITTDYK